MLVIHRLIRERRSQLGAVLHGLLQRDLTLPDGVAIGLMREAVVVEHALSCLERGAPLPLLADLPPSVTYALQAFTLLLHDPHLPRWGLDRWLEANFEALRRQGAPLYPQRGLITQQDCRNALLVLSVGLSAPEIVAMAQRLRGEDAPPPLVGA